MGLVTTFLVTLAIALSPATSDELRGPSLVGVVVSGALVVVSIALELRWLRRGQSGARRDRRTRGESRLTR